MHPILIRVGPLTIHTYGFLIAAGFLVGLYLAVWRAKKEGIPSDRIIDLGFYILLSAIVGSRLLFIIINSGYYVRNPLAIFKIWEGGLVFYGGVLLAVPTAIWYVKRHNLRLWTMADIFAPSIAIGHVFGRLGCFSAGCCFGKAAETLPWGVIFADPECLAPLNIRLHPVQLYESAGELIIFVILMVLAGRKSYKGRLFMTYLLLYAVLRFTVEFFRGDEARGFLMPYISVSQGISIIIFIAALAGMIVLKRRQEKPS